MTHFRTGTRKHPAADRKDRGAEPNRRALRQIAVQRSQIDPASLTPADIKALQRSVGNRATLQLLQKKEMKLGAVNDPLEREADRVADQVVRSVSTAPQPDAAPRMAPTPTPQRGALRRAALDEEEMVQARRQPTGFQLGAFQRAAQAVHGPEGGRIDRGAQAQIQGLRGGGKPLGEGVRRQMERGFGAGFGDVRIHTGATADTLNRSLNARAFTVGNDIVFRKGEYQPGTTGGKTLLAHELTHTLQQGNARVQAKRLVIQRDGDSTKESTEKSSTKNLLDLILTSKYRSKFYEYAQGQYSTNEVDCYKAILAYEKDARRSVAISIFDTYLTNKKDAEKINIPEKLINDIKPEITLYREQKGKQGLLSKFSRKFSLGTKGNPNLFTYVKDNVLNTIYGGVYANWSVTNDGFAFKDDFGISDE